MPVLIGMRCLQAIGSSAVISVGAGSLADMYEVHERGQKVRFLSLTFPILIHLVCHSSLSTVSSFLPLLARSMERWLTVASSDCFMGCRSLARLLVH
jgi:MFS family permease